MSLMSRLLHIARERVMDLMNKILGQVNIVEDQIKARLQSYVAEVLGGVWRGAGADEFIRTVSEEAIPMTNMITGHMKEYTQKIGRAVSMLDDADTRCRAEVNRLADVFERI